MKKSELIFNLFSIPLDAVMIILAGIASFYVRLNFHLTVNSVEYLGPVIYNLNLAEFLNIVYKILPLILILLAFSGLYNLKGSRSLNKEFTKIVTAISVGLFFVIIAFFFNQSLFPSRFIILAAWAFGISFVFFGRVILRLFQKYTFSKGLGLHKIVVIDGNKSFTSAIEKIFKNKTNGYQIVEEVDYPVKGLEYVKKLCDTSKVDEILQANPSLGEEANLELLEFAKARGLQFSFVPNLFEVQRNVVEMWDFEGVPVISLKNSPLEGWGSVAKRIMDILASILCILISSPIFLLVWIAVRLDSKGPAIYSALRVGHRGEFKFHKFRSMYTHLSVGEKFGGIAAEEYRKGLWQQNKRGAADGLILKVKDDPRVTRVGKFIRRTKLDEIPQFWNVLWGEMSMVGPRAHVLDEVERYREKYSRMFSIKPGIFGLSQTAQIFRPDLPFEEEVRLNTYYIENWSLWLDIKILAKTFVLLFFVKKPTDNY